MTTDTPPMQVFRDRAEEALRPVLEALVKSMSEHDELQTRVRQYKVRDNFLAAAEDRIEALNRELAEATRIIHHLLNSLAVTDLRCTDCSGRFKFSDHTPGCPVDVMVHKSAKK